MWIKEQKKIHYIYRYLRGNASDNVNTASYTLLTQEIRDKETVPPAQDALCQHLLRVEYQVGRTWLPALPNTAPTPSGVESDVGEPATCCGVIKLGCIEEVKVKGKVHG